MEKQNLSKYKQSNATTSLNSLNLALEACVHMRSPFRFLLTVPLLFLLLTLLRSLRFYRERNTAAAIRSSANYGSVRKPMSAAFFVPGVSSFELIHLTAVKLQVF